jgi:uncharacterized protein (TIGR03437 family)
MRLFSPFILFCLSGAIAPAAFGIVTLGLSNQKFTLTGIGPNSSGQGQSSMNWGDCSYDGTNTTCTLSGSYTGLGKGGAYSFAVSYPGNGAFPLIAVFQPGSDFFYAQANGPATFVATLTETGGAAIHFYSFANFGFLYNVSAVCTGVPVTSCTAGKVGLTAGATISGPVFGSFDTSPTISPNGIVSAANYGAFPSIAPGTWIEIYGYNLANVLSQTWSGADFNGILAPSALGGTKVTVAGKPAYVDFVSPAQVNVQVPSGITTGQQQIVVTTAGGSSTPYPIAVNVVQPGLLAPPQFIINGSQHVVALFSNTLTYVLPVAVAPAPTARAKPGDNITLYGIGFGSVTPDIPAGQIVEQTNALQAAFKITFAGVPAQVTYAGLAPNYVGLYQFNVIVPNVAASDTVPVAFTLTGGTNSQNLVLAIGK